MNKKIRSLLYSTATASLIALSSVTPSIADTTLKFLSWQVDDAGTGDWWRSVIKAFQEKHSDVKIEFTKVERGAFVDTMTTLFAGGDAPDIVHLASFEFQMFSENEWLEPLDSRIAADKLNLDGWAGQASCEWNGETACIMMNYFGFIMGYNKKLLEEGGIGVPTNYEEYLAAVKATTKDFNGDGITDQFGTGHETKGGAGQYLTEMLNYIIDAGAFWTDKEGNITIDTPQMIEGLSRWKTIIGGGLSPIDMTAGDVRKLFSDGKIALRLDGPWLYATMQEGSAKGDTKIAAPPFQIPLGGSSNVLAIPSEITEEKKDLAWDFIKLAMSPEFQRTYAIAGNTPPNPDTDISGIDADIPHFPLLMKTMHQASEAEIDRIPKGLELNYNEFSKMIMEETQRMIIENLDPATVVKTMQAKAEALKS